MKLKVTTVLFATQFESIPIADGFALQKEKVFELKAHHCLGHELRTKKLNEIQIFSEFENGI